MKQDSTRQSAANRARVQRLRAQYHRRLVAAIIISFILGAVAGGFAYHWYSGLTPRDESTEALAVVTPAPEAVPEPDDQGFDLFLEGEEESEADGAAVQDAFPEVESEAEATEEPVIFPEDEEGEAEPEVTPEAAVKSDEVPEYDPAEAEIPEEYLTLEDENGESEAEEEARAQAEAEETGIESEPEAEPAAETEAEAETEPETEAEAEPATEETEAEPATETEAKPEDGAEAPEAETAADDEAKAPEAEPAISEVGGTQVIAIVPFGESFTYSTQIDANGNARVEAGDGAYETVSFTQTMKSFMRPTDFADQYSKTYKLEGNEAGAGFELILNDYTGEATIIPQNVIDVGLRGETSDTLERGYQLMDAPIDGNYGVALTTNTPKLLYKRYPYSTTGEEMAYLTVTTFNDGVSQMILFELESDEPEPEPTNIYAVLQRGIVSDEVAAMQARLIDLGYLTSVADGTFGGMTEEAIKKAQEAFGMEPNGIADSAFQAKLFEGAESTPAPSAYATLREGSKGETVVNLQLRLRELGYYDGRADGGYGPLTVTAVKKAQAALGFEQTGVADGAFQEKIYEGVEPTPTPQAEATPEAEPTPTPTPNNVGGENTVG